MNALEEDVKVLAEIKNKFEREHIKYAQLAGEVNNCMRYIGVWEIISQMAANRKKLSYETFWAWLQNHVLLRLICIDAVKISEGGRKYVASIVKPILEAEQYKQLIKYSNLQTSLDQLIKLVGSYKEWRHKKYAHFENQDVKSVSIDLDHLFQVLKNLENSLHYIRHYMLNPRYIFDKKWAEVSSLREKNSGNASSERFKVHFEVNGDPIIRDFREMIKKIAH